jgi:Ca2+-binding EF-hand superfamily protein
MMKKVALAGLAAAVIVVPALAVQREPSHHAPITRASVEAMVKSQFAKVDADSDGFVTRAEGEAFREARKAEWQAHRTEWRGERFTALDANGDGSISRDEFMAPRADGGERAGRREHRADRREHRMERRGHRMTRFGARGFERMDADKDGRVSLAEATAARLERFDRVDADKDGTITPEERRAARAARRG